MIVESTDLPTNAVAASRSAEELDRDRDKQRRQFLRAMRETMQNGDEMPNPDEDWHE